MPQFRKVTERFSVSPQITPQEARQAAADGVRLIINNRPDGEAPDQPTGAAIEAAARAAGADYRHLPIVGRPSAETAREQARLVGSADGPVLAFCRSGTRSITAWGLGEAEVGRDRAEIVRLAAAAGYDLQPVLAP